MFRVSCIKKKRTRVCGRVTLKLMQTIPLSYAASSPPPPPPPNQRNQMPIYLKMVKKIKSEARTEWVEWLIWLDSYTRTYKNEWDGQMSATEDRSRAWIHLWFGQYFRAFIRPFVHSVLIIQYNFQCVSVFLVGFCDEIFNLCILCPLYGIGNRSDDHRPIEELDMDSCPIFHLVFFLSHSLCVARNVSNADGFFFSLIRLYLRWFFFFVSRARTFAYSLSSVIRLYQWLNSYGFAL